MNILPKKRWHVRTKENIARVKADEAKFAEEKHQEHKRALLAEQEARTDLLRGRVKSNQRSVENTSKQQSLRLFRDVEDGINLHVTNKEFEEEKKKEQENKEKSIGLLTYLGQSVLDARGEKPWWDVHPNKRKRSQEDNNSLHDEWEAKKKAKADPLVAMLRVEDEFHEQKELKRRALALELERAKSCIEAMPSCFPNDIVVPDKKPTKRNSCLLVQSFVEDTGHSSAGDGADPRHPSSSNHNSPMELAKKAELDRLRSERLQRERRERERAALVMAKSLGLQAACSVTGVEETAEVDERRLPFNSGFNPDVAAFTAERRYRYRESRKRTLS